MAIIPSFTTLITSISFFLSCPTKPFYHSLFISDYLSSSSNTSIANHLYILTRHSHVAGSEANAEAAAYVLSTLTAYNISSRKASYDVAFTYPVSRFLTLESNASASSIKFDLRQEIYNGDPYADVAKEVLHSPFHGLMVIQSSGLLEEKWHMMMGREGRMALFTALVHDLDL